MNILLKSHIGTASGFPYYCMSHCRAIRIHTQAHDTAPFSQYNSHFLYIVAEQAKFHVVYSLIGSCCSLVISTLDLHSADMTWSWNQFSIRMRLEKN